ncbi:glycoside hydrolase family protein [Lusitaniella coriacea LEGE 07157]|uniref:Lysozyme n=1 Tax=Lusitaniella coriacea LEGE 07157 TaxID=945747 RepID=A0A8J7E0Y2_9CYAN|nr:glycoside hydrolase family protein [Lusitaniella coriacea]MBE9117296.1 glycoside hydrolase family protein [Lusitaniella coriacea LEGE 07157]
MARSLEFFKDGRIYEREDGQLMKVSDTQGQVKRLLEVLEFTSADTFTVMPDDAGTREVPVRQSPAKQISAEGLELIKTFEGLYLESYQDAVGVWTIGWGNTEGIGPGMTITVAQAEQMLRKELSQFETAVTEYVKVEINENQYAALVAFSYNVGARALYDSTLLKVLNQGQIQEAADQFLRWDKAGGQALLGLSRRRRSERSLFLSEPWKWALTWEPSRVLKLSQPLLHGDDVRRLQQALADAGFDVQADGYFGEGTDKAVKAFQEQKGLGVDGIVGTQTLKQLGL